MSGEETSADRNVEIWKIKKLIKSLEMARGWVFPYLLFLSSCYVYFPPSALCTCVGYTHSTDWRGWKWAWAEAADGGSEYNHLSLLLVGQPLSFRWHCLNLRQIPLCGSLHPALCLFLFLHTSNTFLSGFYQFKLDSVSEWLSERVSEWARTLVWVMRLVAVAAPPLQRVCTYVRLSVCAEMGQALWLTSPPPFMHCSTDLVLTASLRFGVGNKVSESASDPAGAAPPSHYHTSQFGANAVRLPTGVVCCLFFCSCQNLFCLMYSLLLLLSLVSPYLWVDFNNIYLYSNSISNQQ